MAESNKQHLLFTAQSDQGQVTDVETTPNLNITYEIKRVLRLELNRAKRSDVTRDEVVDRANEIAIAEGMRNTIKKDTLDSWAKDSEPARLPSLPWLVILCHALKSNTLLNVICTPLGCRIVGPEEAKVLIWAKAKLEAERAAKCEKRRKLDIGEFG